MASTKTTPNRGPGRPRSFDRERVLDDVIDLVWTHGPRASGVAEIARVTGLNKSSLYRTFGSKEELLVEALERYTREKTQKFQNGLVPSADGSMPDILDVIVAQLRREAVEDEQRRGCMLISSASELASEDPAVAEVAATYRRTIRDLFHQALEQAANTGQVTPGDPAARADVLVMFVHALASIVRAGAGDDELAALFTAVEATTDAWRS